MSQGHASWSVQLEGNCPCCGEYVDYTEYDDFYTDLNSEDFVRSSQGMYVVCPECKEDFEISTTW